MRLYYRLPSRPVRLLGICPEELIVRIVSVRLCGFSGCGTCYRYSCRAVLWLSIRCDGARNDCRRHVKGLIKESQRTSATTYLECLERRSRISSSCGFGKDLGDLQSPHFTRGTMVSSQKGVRPPTFQSSARLRRCRSAFHISSVSVRDALPKHCCLTRLKPLHFNLVFREADDTSVSPPA